MSDVDSLSAPDEDEGADAGLSAFSTENRFPAVEKKLEEAGHRVFENPVEFYKTLMQAGKESSARLHAIFQKYTTTKDLKDKTVFRMQLIAPFWEHLAQVARGSVGAPAAAKKYALRFGILHPGLLSAENRAFFSKVVDGSFQDLSIYYLDEWIRLVGFGKVKASTTDETPVKRGNESGRISALLDKAGGKIEGNKSLLMGKNAERGRIEETFSALAESICAHNSCDILPQIDEPCSENQRAQLQEIQETAKALLKIDREMNKLLTELASAEEEIKSLKDKLSGGEGAEGGGFDGGGAEDASVDAQAIETEFASIRQMAKMTVGRQGNAFPILANEFYRCMPATVGIKENVLGLLSWIESVDCQAFWRPYKGKSNRVVPYVILLPSYGDFGICWEPYDKRNKATSRGRVAIPMYPKNLSIAVLTAVADLRWQTAKEIASYYWMEEGLTGNYYQWFQAQKLKGDVKMFFIQDYIMWITKESDGTQKLPKEVRNTFWRYLPFAQPLKEKLKDRNLIYQELYQKDMNRALSDGY